MPSLTITVTTDQVQRILVALGISSTAEAQDVIKDWLKRQVASQESAQASQEKVEEIAGEQW